MQKTLLVLAALLLVFLSFPSQVLAYGSGPIRGCVGIPSSTNCICRDGVWVDRNTQNSCGSSGNSNQAVHPPAAPPAYAPAPAQNLYASVGTSQLTVLEAQVLQNLQVGSGIFAQDLSRGSALYNATAQAESAVHLGGHAVINVMTSDVADVLITMVDIVNGAPYASAIMTVIAKATGTDRILSGLINMAWDFVSGTLDLEVPNICRDNEVVRYTESRLSSLAGAGGCDIEELSKILGLRLNRWGDADTQPGIAVCVKDNGLFWKASCRLP